MHYGTTAIALLPVNLDSGETIYLGSIRLFEQALKSDDFHKLTLATAEKVKERRKKWIQELRL